MGKLDIHPFLYLHLEDSLGAFHIFLVVFLSIA